MDYSTAEIWASNYDNEYLEYQNHFKNNIDCSKILDTLLDESEDDYYHNEDDERLNNLIQSLEAEITTNSNNAGNSFNCDQLSCSSLEFNLMDMEDSSSSSNNGDNAHLDGGDRCNIEAFDMLDFEEAENYSEMNQMMYQRVPFVDDCLWEGTDESYMLD